MGGLRRLPYMSLLPGARLKKLYIYVIYKLYDDTINFGYCQVPDL